MLGLRELHFVLVVVVVTRGEPTVDVDGRGSRGGQQEDTDRPSDRSVRRSLQVVTSIQFGRTAERIYQASGVERGEPADRHHNVDRAEVGDERVRMPLTDECSQEHRVLPLGWPRRRPRENGWIAAGRRDVAALTIDQQHDIMAATGKGTRQRTEVKRNRRIVPGGGYEHRCPAPPRSKQARRWVWRKPFDPATVTRLSLP